MLPFDPRHGFLDVRQDGPMEEELRPRLPHQPTKDRCIERLGDRVPFLFRIGQALQGFQKIRPRIDEPDRDSHGGKGLNHPLRFSLAHEGAVDEDRLHPVPQGPVA